VTGQDFKLYPVPDSFSATTVSYQAEILVQHVEPLTHELALLHSRSSPDVSKLENIADRTKSFKHHDLDATLLQTTEVKHANSHRLYRYITIPVLAAILMTIVICYTYPFFFEKHPWKIPCYHTTYRTFQPGEKIQPKFLRHNSPVPVSFHQDSAGTTAFVPTPCTLRPKL
jgi:hypothetical protein